MTAVNKGSMVKGPMVPIAPPLRVVIRPRRGWQALNVAELWRFRDLLFTLAGRDLKVRYKQTALGVSWVVLQPLLTAAIFSFVFGEVAKLPTDGAPTFLFSFAGLLGWNLFSNALSKTGGSLAGNAHLISKVFFPRLILPLSSIPPILVDFSVALALMAGLMCLYRAIPGVGLLVLPVAILVLLMLALGVGLIASSLAVWYRDIQYILPVLLQMMLYASPVAYSVSAVPDKVRAIYRLNPLSAVLETFRFGLLGTPLPPWPTMVYSLLVSMLLMAAGLLAFKRMEREVADVI